ncbi:MAG: DUF4390 domain-containing protein [Candidatus Tectomicrobia bacterium]|nr:DUF4390 domain-containing protein [Candidatus Tectomicrobia bacterium]
MRRNLWDGRGWRCREGASWRRVLILLGGLFLSAVVLGGAEGASLTSVRVSNSPAHLHVYANMEGGITEEIKEAIHSGIPTTFTYLIQLRRHRRFRIDATDFQTAVRQTVKYDALKKEYLFTTDASGVTTQTIEKDFSKVKQLLQGLDRVALMPPARLKQEGTYYVRTKVEIKSIKLIFPLKYLLFFVSLWDVDTNWQSSPRFTLATIPKGEAEL